MWRSTLKSFDAAVATYFVPIANQVNAPLRNLAAGIYEVTSGEFSVRVRYGIGHRRDILVTLLLTSERPADVNDLSKEIGLGAVARFYGESMVELHFDSEEEFSQYANHVASVAEKVLVPYLLGLKSNITELREFVRANPRYPIKNESDPGKK